MGCCCDVGGDDPSPRGPLEKLIFIQSLASRWSHPDWFPDRLPVELFHCGPAFNLQGNNIVPAKFIVMRHDLQLEVYLNMSVIGVQMVEMVVTSRWSNLRKGKKKNRSGQGALVLQREHRSRLPGIKKDHQKNCFKWGVLLRTRRGNGEGSSSPSCHLIIWLWDFQSVTFMSLRSTKLKTAISDKDNDLIMWETN